MPGKKCILVAGGSGYLGAHICRGLSFAGYEVKAWGRLPQNRVVDSLPDSVEYRKGDITLARTKKQMVAQKPHVVVYTISLDHRETEKNIQKALRVNVQPVWELLELLERQGGPIRFIFLSTAQVYGTHTGFIDENTITKPGSYYGMTHLLAEQIMSGIYYSKVESVILRLANGYGSPLSKTANCWWLALNDFCRSGVLESEIVIRSDGTPQRNFIHVRDIVSAVVFFAKTNQLEHRVYNVGGERSYTLLEAASVIADVVYNKCGKRPLIHVQKPSRADINPFLMEYCSERISRLGYRPKVSLKDGCEEMVNYLLTQS